MTPAAMTVPKKAKNCPVTVRFWSTMLTASMRKASYMKKPSRVGPSSRWSMIQLVKNRHAITHTRTMPSAFTIRQRSSSRWSRNGISPGPGVISGGTP